MATQTPNTAEVGSATEAAAYVYGVTWASAAAPDGDGVAAGRVGTIDHGELAAIVSPVPSPSVRARRRDLIRHAEILQGVFERETVVPLQFGTVFASRTDVVAELLEPRHDDLVMLLRRLAGAAELTVRAFYDEEAVLGEIVRGDRMVADLRRLAAAGSPALRLQLGEAVAAALAAWREVDAEQVVAAGRALARDLVVAERQTDLEVVRAAFLVQRDAVAAFDAAMDEVARAREAVIRFKYTGPLPPHHFVTERWAS
jgi:hypothetical protein